MRDIDVMNYFRVEFQQEWDAMNKSGAPMSLDSIRQRIGFPKLTKRQRIKQFFGM
jgi:hypothetical protein